MDLTARMEYAIAALVELARRQTGPVGDGTPLQAPTIAARQGIPRPYLDQLLLALRRAGIVESVRGPRGGHLLAVAAARVSLRDVYVALEGDGADRGGRRRRSRPGPPGPSALAASLATAWSRARERFLESLDETSIGALARETRRQDEETMYYI